ncbi:MAG: chemotaxis protein CheW [Thermoflexaceae bacterium]|nr:chemotaxis protein CheW [Thermoflexaceae bacterium]
MADYVKPVVFKLGNEEYGVDINLVNGIEKYQQIVPVPNSVAFIKGIINLRGEVVPVYDLRKKFNMPAFSGNGEERKLIVVKLPDIMVALEVDAVSEIHDFSVQDIVKMPDIVMNDNTRFMERVANVNGRLIVLMDINYLLSEKEMEDVKKLKEDLE